MALPIQLAHTLAAPAFALSASSEACPDQVIAHCTAGIIGWFDVGQADSLVTLQRWIRTIVEQLATARTAQPHRKIAPFAVRKCGVAETHQDRAALAVCIAWKVPVIVTSTALPEAIATAIHAYGGLIFKQIDDSEPTPPVPDDGIDGLILRRALAGVRQLRQHYRGAIVWSGAIASGEELLAAEAMGADLVCVGRRFDTGGNGCAANELIDEYMTAKLRITQHHRL